MSEEKTYSQVKYHATSGDNEDSELDNFGGQILRIARTRILWKEERVVWKKNDFLPPRPCKGKDLWHVDMIKELKLNGLTFKVDHQTKPL